MKANAEVSALLRTSHNVEAVPRLMVEWNLNRYRTVTADSEAPEQDYAFDTELFPIESIIGVNRPTKGIAKARIGHATIAANEAPDQNTRFYLAHEDDIYKYWTSPIETNATGTFPSHSTLAISEGLTGDTGTAVRPFIKYDTNYRANKIVIKTENTFATIKTFEVSVFNHTGDTWTLIPVSAYTGAFDNATGQLTLWWNGIAWSATRPSGILQTTMVGGVKLAVQAMGPGKDLDGVTTTTNDGATTGNNSYFDLIEIAACLEADLTDKLISVDDTFDIGESSIIYPIGQVTSNNASISLSNLYSDVEVGLGPDTSQRPGLFSNDNPESPFQGLADQNAIFNLEYIFTDGTVERVVQQFKMYAEPWGVADDESVSVPLRDYTKFFDEQKPAPTYWLGMTVSEIIWRLCDTLGFVDYVVEDGTSISTIDYWWTDGEKTMWEIIGELAMATQTAVYYDSLGRLRIKGREEAYKEAPEAFVLRSNNSGGELANIISLEQQGTPQTNHVTVKYYTSDLATSSFSVPKMERVYEPEGTVLLRSSVMKGNIIGPSAPWVIVSPQDATIWPYTTLVQIQGELIRIDGKEYLSANSSGQMFPTVVKSKAEKDKIDNATPRLHLSKNAFTGRLKISERGVWNSEVKSHFTEANGYSVRKYINSAVSANKSGFSHRPNLSRVNLKFADARSAKDVMVATRGTTLELPYYHYGTRLKFVPTSRSVQRAGIVINNQGTTEQGYYIDLQVSSKTDDKVKNELTLIRRNASGDKFIGGKGRGATVIESKATDVWYDLDVRLSLVGSDHRIEVALNGEWVIDQTITGADKLTLNGRFGMFLRGDTEAEFEYLYATRNQPNDLADEISWWDGVTGGYLSQRWEKEWVYGNEYIRRKKGSRKARKKTHERLMDEFGPYVHEVREMDVKFDPFPVTYTKITSSNPAVICMGFYSDSFSAKFILANASRNNEIANGEDTRSNGGQQVLLIHGRTLTVKDAQQVVKFNETQVRANGRIESEVDSQWIQSEKVANDIAEWIDKHWSTGADEIEVTIFGNPLIEVGDVIAIEYPERFMAQATHKYFVTAVNNDFQNGIETSLTLRRNVGLL